MDLDPSTYDISTTPADKIKILDILGEGGYSIVYKAEHTDWGPVAYKKLRIAAITETEAYVILRDFVN